MRNEQQMRLGEILQRVPKVMEQMRDERAEDNTSDSGTHKRHWQATIISRPVTAPCFWQFRHPSVKLSKTYRWSE